MAIRGSAELGAFLDLGIILFDYVRVKEKRSCEQAFRNGTHWNPFKDDSVESYGVPFLRKMGVELRIKRARAVKASFLIAIATLVRGCQRPPSKNDGEIPAISARSQLSQTRVGKRVTIRGGLFRFKCGPGIQFDDGAVVCVVDSHRRSGLDDPYAEMYEKIVEATGTLGFYHAPTPLDETRSAQGQHDRYYLEKEGTPVRIIANYTNDAAASIARSKLSTLIGKQITVRGKLLNFGFPVCTGILLDDEDVVCLEDERPRPISDPYPGMYEKRVEATGTLRFFHDHTVMDENAPRARVPDHFYFESETTRVRLLPK